MGWTFPNQARNLNRSEEHGDDQEEENARGQSETDGWAKRRPISTLRPPITASYKM